MPDGYRRRPQVLESPYLGIGAGLGGILSSYFMAKRGKKEAEIENVGRVFQRATLTGDPEPIRILLEENPEAAEAFRARTGIDIFRMALPEMDMPEKMEIGEPSGIPPFPQAPEEATGIPPEYPFPQVPPAVVQAPQPTMAPKDIPYPVEPQGVQARVMQEQIAGRGAELPEALQKPEPSPLSLLIKDYKGIGTTLESLPTQRLKQAFLQATEEHMPQGFPTEYTGLAVEPPSPKDIELMNKLYAMSPEERETWRTTGIAPFRAPRAPETPEMRMTIAEYIKAYGQPAGAEGQAARDADWVAFLESDGATIPQRAPTIQSDKNTEVSLFNRSFEIAMLTGESQPEVYQQLVANTYDSKEYLVEKKKSDEIRMLRWMLMDAYKVGDDTEAKKMLQRISVLTGIPYEPRRNIKEQILDFLRGTQKYASPSVPELETESDFDRAFKQR